MQVLGGEWASFTPQHGQTSRTASESLSAYNENLEEARILKPEPPKMSGLTPTQADMDWYNQQMGFSTSVSKPGAEKQEPPGASPRRNLMQEVAPSFIGPPAPTVTKPELGPQSIPLGRRPPQQPGS